MTEVVTVDHTSTSGSPRSTKNTISLKNNQKIAFHPVARERICPLKWPRAQLSWRWPNIVNKQVLKWPSQSGVSLLRIQLTYQTFSPLSGFLEIFVETLYKIFSIHWYKTSTIFSWQFHLNSFICELLTTSVTVWAIMGEKQERTIFFIAANRLIFLKKFF